MTPSRANQAELLCTQRAIITRLRRTALRRLGCRSAGYRGFMQIARVIGNVVSTSKSEKLDGLEAFDRQAH